MSFTSSMKNWRKLHTHLSKRHLQGVCLEKIHCGTCLILKHVHLGDLPQALTHNSNSKHIMCPQLLSFTTRYCYEMKDKAM